MLIVSSSAICWVPRILFWISFAFRLWYALFFHIYGNDSFVQQFASQNFLNGNGVSLSTVTTLDPDTLYMQAMTKWPPLLVILQAFFLYLLKDWILVSIFLTSVSVLSFFLLVRSTLRLLQVRSSLQALTWLLLISNHLLFDEFGVSDWLGLTSVAAAFFFCLYLLFHNSNLIVHAVLAVILFSLPAMFRYQYYSIVMLFPVWLVYVAFRFKSDLKRIALFVFFLTSMVFIFIVFGSALYGTNTQVMPAQTTGFYPNNLFHFDPFLLKTVVRLDYITFKYPLWIQEVTLITRVLNLILFILFIFIIVRAILRKNDFYFDNYIRSVFLLVLFFIGAMLLFLSIMSMVYAPTAPPLPFFTYVQEARYFAAIKYLSLLLIIVIFDRMRVHYSMGIIMMVFLCFNLLLFCKFLYNTSKFSAPIYQLDWAIQDRKEARNAIEKFIQKNDYPLIISWYPMEYLVMGHYSKETYILSNHRLIFSGVQNSVKPYNLLFCIQTDLLSSSQKQFLDNNYFVEIFNNSHYQIFIKEVSR